MKTNEPVAWRFQFNNGETSLCGNKAKAEAIIKQLEQDESVTPLYAAQPAPIVPVGTMENIALNEWLDKTEWVQKELNAFPVSSLGMHRADVMRLEIERLREMLANPPAPSVPDGWKHDCAGVLQNDVELWVDSCPHCGKPRPATPTPDGAPADVVRDAERYRWLKCERFDKPYAVTNENMTAVYEGDELDLVIDAAIAAEKGGA